MANKIKFHSGDVNGIYEPSDSEDEYTEHEKSLLKKVRRGRQRNADPEKELLSFQQPAGDSEDESDFDEKFEADSDIADDDNDDIPDSRAWGKKRRDFYSTDFVDQDYSSYNTREEDLADEEEAEARAIQQRLAQQLEDTDFSLNVFGGAEVTPSKGKKKKKAEPEGQKTYLKADLSELTEREQQQLFQKDSPEFDGLVDDFQQKLEESKNLLVPILTYFKQISLSNRPIVDFVVTKNNLILNYCSNIAFYLVLKAKRISVKNHPIVKRLVQTRQLLLQLEERYSAIVKPQLEQLLEAIRNGEEIEFETGVASADNPFAYRKQHKKLGVIKSIDEKQSGNAVNDSDDYEDDDDGKTFAEKLASSDSDNADKEMEVDEEDDDGRRAVTYQIMKNKGLTPYRKKELRNPRVKHRKKYDKALIRRKGAVRTVRKEIHRYDGEKFGIKATTKKGIKIK